MNKERRFLMVEPNPEVRELLVENISAIVTNAQFIFANDGSEAMFKLANAPVEIVILSGRITKYDAIHLTEWILRNKNLEKTGVLLISPVPDEEQFVDQIVVGRVQFVPSLEDKAHFERTVSRVLNFVLHGDKGEFFLRFLASNETLMKEGEKADNVYLVRKGRLRAVHRSEQKETLLGYVEVGEFVGEMAYINGEARSADVQAESPCELIEIPIAHLDHVLFLKPSWSKALVRTLSKRLKSVNQTLTKI
jgi:hypothetical protein